MPVNTNVLNATGLIVAKAEDLSTTGADLFVINGLVRLLALVGEVTNEIGAGVTDYDLHIKTLGTQIVGVTNMAGKTPATLLQLAGGEAFYEGANGAKLVTSGSDPQQVRYIGTTGGTCTLQSAHTAGDSGDAITWYLIWLPVSPGSSVAAA